MASYIYFIATSLPDRLASVRDALLLKHPSELTIELPTFTASLATAATDVTAATITIFSRSRGRSGRRGSQGAGGSGGGGVSSGGGRSAGVGEVPRAAASDSPAAASRGDDRRRQTPAGLPNTGAGVVAWFLTQRQNQQQ
ncbi:unnamed protein product [Closterium sp. NIES-65]|nr:unnamed protein product [Closterium sp. NIES-65]